MTAAERVFSQAGKRSFFLLDAKTWRISGFLVVGLAVLSAPTACSDWDRSLGRVSAAPPLPLVPAGPFADPTLISELSSTSGEDQDPTLTADELEMFFTSSRGGGLDIWSTTRTTSTSAWSEPIFVPELSTDCVDQSPEVSADGLSLYLVNNCVAPSGAARQFHLWQSERATRTSAWGEPVAVSNPAAEAGEVSPSLDSSGLFLAYASLSPASGYDLYLSERAAPDAAWGAPAPLATLNSTSHDWDPALFTDATRLIFASARVDNGNLFEAEREHASQPFNAPTERAELNSPAVDGDPWVSADGRRIYFFSKRTGANHLYFSHR